MLSETIIETKNLCKRYGDRLAVDNLNLQIKAGEIYGLLGPNGAGKTTTILMILGLSEPTSGEINVAGFQPTRNPLDVKRLVGYLPDDVGFYEDMTARENLRFTARLNNMDAQRTEKIIEETLERVGLAAAADQKAGTFSRGMRQRLGLADVLIKQPKIIILDEPTLGIDPSGIKELLQLIRQLSKDDGLTVLLSSHLLHQVQKICDRVGLFVGGKLLAQGSLAELTAQVMGNVPWLIELEWAPGTDNEPAEKSFQKYCSEHPEINSFEQGAERWLLRCRNDVRAEVARWLHEQGANLLHMSIHSVGLDDIYERYFGGDREHEQQQDARPHRFKRLGANRK